MAGLGRPAEGQESLCSFLHFPHECGFLHLLHQTGPSSEWRACAPPLPSLSLHSAASSYFFLPAALGGGLLVLLMSR